MVFAFIKSILRPNIWFILGPSGAGKTTFCEYLSNQHNWIHLNYDAHDPHLLDTNKLEIENELNLFISSIKVRPLYRKIRNKFSSLTRAGIVLSFPSTFLFNENHIRSSKKYFKIVYLYGSQQNCLNAFLEREQLYGSNLEENYWHCHNQEIYKILDYFIFSPWIVDVFHHNNKRKNAAEIYEQIAGIN